MPDAYYRMKAAKGWNIPWSEFLRLPVQRRAEMQAFELAEATVAGYEAEKREEELESGTSGGGGEKTSFFDPMASERTAMKLPKL